MVRQEKEEYASVMPRHEYKLCKHVFAAMAIMASCCAIAKNEPGTVEWLRQVSPDNDRYCGWPTICDIGGGEVAVVFSGDRRGHVCPWGKVQIVRSKDCGETWSEAETICNTVLDDRDAGLLRLANGDLVLFWFTSAQFYEAELRLKRRPDDARHFEKLGNDAVRRDLGSFSCRSSDGGRTWSEKVRLPTSAPHGGTQLADGRIIVVGNQHPRTRGHLSFDPEEKARLGTKPDLVVAESTDFGRSWHELSRIPSLSEHCEPYVIETADGVLQCYARTMRNLHHTESRDGGRTWTALVDTAIPAWESPPHLLRLKDGRILLTYARRVRDKKKDPDARIGVYARVGEASGAPASFEAAPEIPICYNTVWDIGYASSAQLDEDSLLTAFYGHEKGPAAAVFVAKWKVSAPLSGR